jgi:hypothetical protein
MYRVVNREPLRKQQNARRIDRLLARTSLQAKKEEARKTKRRSLDECRIHDLNKLARFRYGRDFVLPDTADGRALAMAMITHQPYKPSEWLDRFCGERAPWLDPDEIDRKALRPKKAAALGQDLNLEAVERLILKICSIRPYDMTCGELTAWLKKRKRRRDAITKQARRRIAGKQSRAEYLASHAKSRTKPWQQLGLTRAQFYRKGLHRIGRETSVSPTIKAACAWTTCRRGTRRLKSDRPSGSNGDATYPRRPWRPLGRKWRV